MRDTTPEKLLDHEISTLAWDYKSKEYRARLPHKRFAYTTVWRILKKRTLEEAKDFLKKVSESHIPDYSPAHNKDIRAIYKQALNDIAEVEKYVEMED